MVEQIEDKVNRSLKAAEELYYRLVLIVGESGSGKTSVVRNVAKLHHVEPININLHISKALLELNEKQRQLKLSELMKHAVNGKGNTVFLDNIEILFDAQLKQNPLRLLQGLSRNLTILSSWNGSVEKGKLTYAEPGHSEYRNYDITDTLVVRMSGEENVDFKESSEDKQI